MSRETVVDRRRWIYHALLWLLGIFLSLVLISMLTLTAVGTARILDCTSPGGTCNKQGRDSQSGAVGTINKITVTAVYCAKLPGNVTLAQITNCVETNLK